MDIVKNSAMDPILEVKLLTRLCQELLKKPRFPIRKCNTLHHPSLVNKANELVMPADTQIPCYQVVLMVSHNAESAPIKDEAFHQLRDFQAVLTPKTYFLTSVAKRSWQVQG